VENKSQMEKRSLGRKRLTGLLPGGLFTRNKDRIDCKPVDISEQGLSIISSMVLKPGDIITLAVKDKPIDLTVVWSKPDFGKQDLFRYGLASTDSAINLVELFEQKRCLK
jgi:hypothetical protein